MCVPVFVWKSEDNLRELFLSSHHVVCRNTDCQTGRQGPLPSEPSPWLPNCPRVTMVCNKTIRTVTWVNCLPHVPNYHTVKKKLVPTHVTGSRVKFIDHSSNLRSPRLTFTAGYTCKMIACSQLEDIRGNAGVGDIVNYLMHWFPAVLNA